MPTPDVVTPEPTPDPDWDGVRLHIVTGKGGTGKTTIAAALAYALATAGGRVLVVEVEGRQDLAGLFGSAPLDYTERTLARPGAGEVLGLSVDPKEALLEYLQMFYRLGRAGGLLERFGAIDFATTIAPGVRDVLLTGKVYEAVQRKRAGRPVYDAVVLDAPPTGRIQRFLNINDEVVGLARVGPIRNQADSIMTMMRSTQTVIHFVTGLEEMPIQETIDGMAALQAGALRIGGIVANNVYQPQLSARRLAAARRGDLPEADVAAGLAAAGLASSYAPQLLAQAREHAELLDRQRREQAVLNGLGRPVYVATPTQLPQDLPHLAACLRAQGMA
jgi:anion-transporting  ArsA/GET3 family ATPase